MSVGEISSLHQTYILLSERFKASWTFHQFLQGLYKSLLQETPPFHFEFQESYENLKKVSAQISSSNSTEVRGIMQRLDQRLKVINSALLAEDSKLSPSLLRRFFEKVKGQDEKILFALIKFYLLSGNLDREIFDKLDFLFTKLGEARDRGETHRKIQGLLAPRALAEPRPGVVNQFRLRLRELAAEVEKTSTFEELTNRQLLASIRNLKQEMGELFLHPEVMVEVVETNIAVKNAFARLYRVEEQRILEDSARIQELERDLEAKPGAAIHLQENLEEYKRIMETYQTNVREENVKHQDVVQLKTSMHELLMRFDRAWESGDELTLEEVVDDTEVHPGAAGPATAPVTRADMPVEDETLQPYSDKLLFSLDYLDPSMSASAAVHARELLNLRLEPYEVESCRAVLGRGVKRAATDRDRLFLKAAALRLKIDEEARELLRLSNTDTELAPLLDRAKHSLDVAQEYDRQFQWQIDEALYEHQSSRMREIHRSKFRLIRGFAGLWLLYDKLTANA